MRTTIQSQAVIKLLKSQQHASNYDLFRVLKKDIPTLTLPSVHRITARLISEGTIGAIENSGRKTILDFNPARHSHFYCTKCHSLMNIGLDKSIISSIQNQIGQNVANQDLVVYGTCLNCQKVSL